MAWEWVGTAAIGIVGIVATAYTSRRGQQHAETMAVEAREGQVADRRYAETREAYLGWLQHMQRLNVRIALRMRDPEGLRRAMEQARTPEYAANQEILYARIIAFGSPEMFALVLAYNSALENATQDPERLQRETDVMQEQIRRELRAMNGLPEDRPQLS